MIVVAGRLRDAPAAPTPALAIAARAAGLGAAVEIVGVLSEGPGGDRRLLELTAQGVRHTAITRSPAPTLDPADLELALRYLPEIGAIVLVDDGDGLVDVAGTAAAWSGATFLVVGAHGQPAAAVPDDALVLERPASDPDGAFAGVVAALAVRLASGADPRAAWTDTLSALGVSPASGRA